MRYDNAEIFISKYDDPLTVSFDYYKGSPAVRYLRNGDPGYPSEPAEVDLISVKLNGIEVSDTISVKEEDEIMEACFEWIADYDEPDEYDRADYERDCAIDRALENGDNKYGR